MVEKINLKEKVNSGGAYNDSDELAKNTDRIHTTDLGAGRIKKNLGLKTGDIVSWCVKKIENAEKIIRRGKNWYVYSGGVVITINAKSYTVITAHKSPV